MDHGPEWPVNFSIRKQTPHTHLSNFDYTIQNFLMTVHIIENRRPTLKIFANALNVTGQLQHALS